MAGLWLSLVNGLAGQNFKVVGYNRRMDIQTQIPPHDIERAIEIFWAAFSQKLGPILGDDHRARDLLADSLNQERLIAAYIDGQLMGVAGLEYERQTFLEITPRLCIKHFGFLGGLRRFLVMGLLFAHKIPNDTLYLDSLAVHPDARGMGVGTRLLGEFEALARQKGFAKVRMDVVDTNPRAKALYERQGFVVAGEQSLPFWQNRMGFAKSYEMVKDIDN